MQILKCKARTRISLYPFPWRKNSGFHVHLVSGSWVKTLLFACWISVLSTRCKILWKSDIIISWNAVSLSIGLFCTGDNAPSETSPIYCKRCYIHLCNLGHGSLFFPPTCYLPKTLYLWIQVRICFAFLHSIFGDQTLSGHNLASPSDSPELTLRSDKYGSRLEF